MCSLIGNLYVLHEYVNKVINDVECIHFCGKNTQLEEKLVCVHQHLVKLKKMQDVVYQRMISKGFSKDLVLTLVSSDHEERFKDLLRNIQIQPAIELEDKKVDLSKWMYPELRDKIATTCDINILHECRFEVNRRLKVYHAWKSKTTKNTNKNQRYPSCIVNSNKNIHKTCKIDSRVHRYYKIALEESNNVWWYVHYFGPYVARQMELHPNKKPILLSEGVNDLEICELALDETVLGDTIGAEIFESEFNTVWIENDGIPYKIKLWE